MINRRLIRIKVMQTFYAHLITNDRYDITKPTKEFHRHVIQFHYLYLFLLDLMNEIQRYAEQKYEIETNKFIQNRNLATPYLRLLKNKFINKFAQSEAFQNYKKNIGFSWVNNQDIIKTIATQFTNSEIFQLYLTKEQNFENDKKLIFNFYNTFLKEQCPDIYIEAEEMNIYWADTVDHALNNCAKTIVLIHENTAPEQIEILPPYKKTEDLDFGDKLLKLTIENEEKLFEYIKPFISQWEFERLFKLDMIILQLATTEFLEFPTIPILATVDEYVEIAKEYCTEKSWAFVNGILDRIIHNLCKQGKIKKLKDGCEKFGY